MFFIFARRVNERRRNLNEGHSHYFKVIHIPTIFSPSRSLKHLGNTDGTQPKLIHASFEKTRSRRPMIRPRVSKQTDGRSIWIVHLSGGRMDDRIDGPTHINSLYRVISGFLLKHCRTYDAVRSIYVDNGRTKRPTDPRRDKPS